MSGRYSSSLKIERKQREVLGDESKKIIFFLFFSIFDAVEMDVLLVASRISRVRAGRERE